MSALLLCLLSFVQLLPVDDVDELAKQFEASHTQRIKDLKELVARTKQSLRRPGGRTRQQRLAIVKSLTKQLREAEGLLKELEGWRFIAAPQLTYPVKVGDIGRFEGAGDFVDGYVRVAQVIDDSSMLVDAYFSETVNVPVGESRSLTGAGGRTIHNRHRLLLKSFPTKGAVDGQPLGISIPVRITGTETYDSIDGGSLTVLVAEPIDMSPVISRMRERARERLSK